MAAMASAVAVVGIAVADSPTLPLPRQPTIAARRRARDCVGGVVGAGGHRLRCAKEVLPSSSTSHMGPGWRERRVADALRPLGGDVCARRGASVVQPDFPSTGPRASPEGLTGKWTRLSSEDLAKTRPRKKVPVTPSQASYRQHYHCSRG